MRVLVADIIEKARGLSPDYEKQVAWDGTSHHAEVTSVNAPIDGGDPEVYAVSIKPAVDRDGKTIDPDSLAVICECPSAKLCYHLAMFYGLVKKISGATDSDDAEPEDAVAEETTQEPPTSTDLAATAIKPDEAPKIPGSRIQALQLISGGIEMLVDGIAQIARSTAREEAKVVVAEMLREKEE